jgi:hypothetical protein
VTILIKYEETNESIQLYRRKDEHGKESVRSWLWEDRDR